MKTNATLLAILLFGMSIAGCVGDEIVNPIGAPAPIEYIFTGSDADDSVSTSNNDTLVELTMTEGDRDHPLTWSYLSVKISVNAGSVIECSDIADGDGCFWTQLEVGGEGRDWDQSEKISISEDSMDLCSDGTACDVEVELRRTTPDESATIILEDMQITAE